ncbi:MAG: replication initiation protein [Desulfuromonadales bacterium]|nr:replication initiation protein [Desulfuromonadales bacterium]
MESAEDYIIKKHNAIIHRTHAATPTEEKLFSALLMAARAQMKSGIEPSNGQFRTTIKFLRNFTKISATNNQYLKDALTGLQERPWQYDMFVEDKFQEWRSFPPISEVRIDKFGAVSFYFAPTIMEALNNPSIYTQIDLKIIRGLKSVYSIALYELGMTHIGERKEFSVIDYRNYMGLKEGEYAAPADLRRHVVEPAVREVNEKTDIRVELQLLKRGPRGALTGFAFTFDQVEEVEILPESHQLELIAELCALLPEGIGVLRGVVPLLKRMLEAHNEDYVRSNIQYFTERVNDKNQAPIPSPGGYLRRVLENDYGLEIRERREVERIMEEKIRQGAAEKTAHIDVAHANKLAEDEEIFQIQEKYYTYFQSLAAERQADIVTRIEKSGLYIGPIKTQIMGFLQMEERVNL